MAINIKNPSVCELLRRAAEQTGRTQVSVLEEALERYLADLSSTTQREERLTQVLAQIDEQMTPQVRAAIRRDMEELYDEHGLPA